MKPNPQNIEGPRRAYCDKESKCLKRASLLHWAFLSCGECSYKGSLLLREPLMTDYDIEEGHIVNRKLKENMRQGGNDKT